MNKSSKTYNTLNKLGELLFGMTINLKFFVVGLILLFKAGSVLKCQKSCWPYGTVYRKNNKNKSSEDKYCGE